MQLLGNIGEYRRISENIAKYRGDDITKNSGYTRDPAWLQGTREGVTNDGAALKNNKTCEGVNTAKIHTF